MVKPSMSHDASPEAFAEAMARCRGWAPRCSDAGECDRDGDCFRSEKMTVIHARRAILNAAECESGEVARLMRDAARLLVERHNAEVGAVAAAAGTRKRTRPTA